MATSSRRPEACATEKTPLGRCAQVLDADSQRAVVEDSISGRLWCFLRNNDTALTFTVFTTLATAPTLLFGGLHMASFLNMHHITLAQVASAQLLFMIWNILNDILAGYWSDAHAARYGSRVGLVCGVQIVWVVTTVLPFVPMTRSATEGMAGTAYYLLCISIQDLCLSLVGAARGALANDIANSEADCVHLKRLNTILGNAEAIVVMGGYALWSASSPWPFLMFLSVAVTGAVICNIWCAARLGRCLPTKPLETADSTLPSMVTFLRSLPTNAWVYVAISALHALHGVAWGQFAVPLIEMLLADTAKTWRVLLLGGLSGAGGVVAFLLTWPAERTGLYGVILWTFRIKVIAATALGLFALAWGFSNKLIICTSMLLNEVSMAILSGFHMVVMVNLMDELAIERLEAGSAHALAAYSKACGPSLLVASTGLLVKPFHSAGTVLGTAFLRGEGSGHLEQATARSRGLALLVVVPLVTGALQWAMWSRAMTVRGRWSGQRH